MNTREKWLVALMGFALIYGAYALLTNGGSPASGANAAEEALPEVMIFAKTMSEAAAADRLTDREEELLHISMAAWPPSPFYDRTDRARPTVDAPTEVRYTGFFHFGTNRLAIINNREYRLGEAIAHTDFHVAVIESNRVVLSADEGRRRVPIALKELSHLTRESL